MKCGRSGDVDGQAALAQLRREADSSVHGADGAQDGGVDHGARRYGPDGRARNVTDAFDATQNGPLYLTTKR
jgi:hypothetical protein